MVLNGQFFFGSEKSYKSAEKTNPITSICLPSVAHYTEHEHCCNSRISIESALYHSHIIFVMFNFYGTFITIWLPLQFVQKNVSQLHIFANKCEARANNSSFQIDTNLLTKQKILWMIHWFFFPLLLLTVVAQILYTKRKR